MSSNKHAISLSLGISLFLMVFLSCSRKGEVAWPEYAYEKAIERNIGREKAIIQSYEFTRKDVDRKGLLSAEALAFAVHSWEFYTYKGRVVEREAIVSCLPEIAKNLGVPIDGGILGKMNKAADLDVIAEVKDYFYNALDSKKKFLQANVYMRSLARLRICFSMHGLFNAIEKTDKKGIAVGNAMLAEGLGIAELLARQERPPREFQEQIVKLRSAVAANPISNKEQANALQKEIEGWFDGVLDAQLTDWGGKKMVAESTGT